MSFKVIPMGDENSDSSSKKVLSTVSNSISVDVGIVEQELPIHGQQNATEALPSQASSNKLDDTDDLPDYEDDEETQISSNSDASPPAQPSAYSNHFVDILEEALEEAANPVELGPEDNWSAMKGSLSNHDSHVHKAPGASGYGNIGAKAKEHAAVRHINDRIKKRTGKGLVTKAPVKAMDKSFLDRYLVAARGSLSQNSQNTTMPTVEDPSMDGLINAMAKWVVIDPILPTTTLPKLQVGSLTKRNINGKREDSDSSLSNYADEESWRSGVFCRRIYKKMRARDTQSITNRCFRLNGPGKAIFGHLSARSGGLRHQSGTCSWKPDFDPCIENLCQLMGATKTADPNENNPPSTDVLEARGMDIFMVTHELQTSFSWAGYNQHDVQHPTNLGMDSQYDYATVVEVFITPQVLRVATPIRTVKGQRRSDPYGKSQRRK